MNIAKLSVCVAAAGLALAGGAAHATIYDDVFTGTVTGIDTLGLFGAQGSVLNTQFTASFKNDTSKGTNNSQPPILHEVEGGIAEGTTDPVRATLTINGITFPVGTSGYFGSVEIYNDPNATSGKVAEVRDEAADASTLFAVTYVNDLYIDVYSYVSTSGFPTDFAQRYKLPVDGTKVIGTGMFTYGIQSGGKLTPLESLTLTPTTASAPEPSTWALMLGGLAFIGAMLRGATGSRGPRGTRVLAQARSPISSSPFKESCELSRPAKE